MNIILFLYSLRLVVGSAIVFHVIMKICYDSGLPENEATVQDTSVSNTLLSNADKSCNSVILYTFIVLHMIYIRKVHVGLQCRDERYCRRYWKGIAEGIEQVL